jgi:hypothetical protein
MTWQPIADVDEQVRDWMKAKGWEVTATDYHFDQEIYARVSARTDDRLTIIAKQLRAKRLSALSAGDIQDFVNALRECGLAPRTVRMTTGLSARHSLPQSGRRNSPTTSPPTPRSPGRQSGR